jgi:hypothetical protein
MPPCGTRDMTDQEWRCERCGRTYREHTAYERDTRQCLAEPVEAAA